MTPQQIAQQCRDQMALAGEGTWITLVMPGRANRETRRLCPGGPVGRIHGEAGPGRVIVGFEAKKVLDYLLRKGLAP